MTALFSVFVTLHKLAFSSERHGFTNVKEPVNGG